ncbi:gluconate 2-dehydrogenase subunit 3 family protein [Fibrivirga algicola]|uniref:Gluconate 2-dehydrogenase subunit 3 family protein n=1 Tax=Fibrivirga algicola TaxID=2950420 RepID=A0ABX0QAM0_9BACT|nr:gluconate 2-dehydrogenase subunit 3 family protein [Fibrivirga algicola]ARK13110.1 transcriptional initiation protein Tat [Fibrella sp. ES10-3-2-2]NID09309.1 gluconate 2-dehydrogenase subunit 3 family protein [Fibrivirga algicola]
MKRRDSLKALSLSSLGLAVGPVEAAVPAPPDKKVPLKVPGGRQPFEAERDVKLNAEKFFTPAELKTVTLLADIILPADAKSGSASQAGVPAFIEFMMKDQPVNQTPMRGGLAWLDNQCRKRFGKPFAEATRAQQIEMVDLIAYPQQTKPEFSQGAAFFTLMRNFTLTGFYTSKMGIEDLGYKGNTPNNWDGPPEAVLKQYGLV